ncbi:cyclase family protein [Streptomyces sp. PLK6-54]|uniref:Cyclase family protein n=1 Tax=Actinacidiphila acidipaludis TaxID=2873382 RepID=A0ABS7QHU1_9ACTN|nr:cyclase family protein [Streptomyces acidipaludis]MBY8882740.1 cyclase family protein [Streptomyces acidipaludis]
MSVEEFAALHEELAGRTAWAAGPRGALAALTPDKVVAAAREVRLGRGVSLAAPVEFTVAPDDPEPARHTMLGPDIEDTPAVLDSAEGLHFVTDRLAMNVHGDANSHLDALTHIIWNGTLHGGVRASTVTSEAATALSVEIVRDGITGRGVLLDIPRLRGVPWIEPGDHVTGDELRAAEESQQVRVTEGDLLFVRVGHRRRRAELGAWDTARSHAGLHPTALEFLAERRVALLGCDSNSDTAPSLAEGVGWPVHVLAIHAMGLHLLDYLQFEDLVPLCEEQRRWSFLCVVAPLRLPGGTGSPVNPVAVL